MCGIAGFADGRLTYDPAQALRAMADAIAHRGPDAEGHFLENEVGMAFRRLSIIDPAGGGQPLYSEDGQIVLTCNGEIYNFQDLRADLELRGHVFATKSDAEVVLHGYEEYGEDIVQHLRGMFAFVLYDRAARKFFGARDPFGIKPLYLYQRGGTFLYASEIKAFLPHPQFRRALNEKWLSTYLCFEYVPCSETLFADVHKLPPGHTVTYENGTLTTKRYFTPAYEIRRGKPLSAWADELEAVFAGSCRAHRVSDVPVGCFLSGGVDSAWVTRMAGPVRAFSIGYAEQQYSELPAAVETARRLGIPCETTEITAEDFFAAVPTVQWHMDEPLPNPSAIPLYYLSRLAAQQVKVVLSGEGADELFGGYSMYQEGLVFSQYAHVPQALRDFAGDTAERLPPFHGRRFLMRGRQPLEQRYLRQNYVFTAGETGRYLRRDPGHIAPETLTAPIFARVRGEDEVTQMQYADLCTWLPYDILQKADKMSMAASLELRVPFLDREVYELAMQLPPEVRVTRKGGKRLLRAAAGRTLPESTAQAKKIGFVTPLNDWLRQERYYDMVHAAFASDAAGQFFRQDALLARLEEHRAGKDGGMKRIWSVYCFLVWYQVFFGQGGAGC